MLPHVVAEQRALAVHQRRILVGAGLDRELAVASDGDEPPARAEYPQPGRVEVGLELVEAAEIALGRRGDLAIGLLRAGPHDLPEHRVIGMAAAVVAHHGANTFG